ncbi:hypothetical protein EDD15DRAFT_2383006 [Pisolithus albus]|nr:hypothetical protein EDD15DRAFT_2383006 [Pisolithus albus]
MKTDQPVRLASDTDDEEVFFFPRAPSQPTAKHEHDQSPLSPQHSPNSSIPSSSTRSTVPIPIPLNHLTDPTMGKIILGAVSEEMRPFAQAYNRMLDTLGNVIRIAERALQD